ncbi:hypothetical protein FHG87_005262 [Trinorchestia longiramus]|nr:hypothetical protein FHG87_005262 [Trinorchestia longiramus]
MGTWGAVLLLVLLCVAPALAQTWLQWFMSWMTWFLPPTHEPLHQNGYNNEIKCKNPGRGCGPEQRPLLHGSSGLGYYEPQPNPPAKIKDTSSSNTFHNFPENRLHPRSPLRASAAVHFGVPNAKRPTLFCSTSNFSRSPPFHAITIMTNIMLVHSTFHEEMGGPDPANESLGELCLPFLRKVNSISQETPSLD